MGKRRITLLILELSYINLVHLISGINLPDKVGFPIGGTSSEANYLLLEMHYDNPNYQPGNYNYSEGYKGINQDNNDIDNDNDDDNNVDIDNDDNDYYVDNNDDNIKYELLYKFLVIKTRNYLFLNNNTLNKLIL